MTRIQISAWIMLVFRGLWSGGILIFAEHRRHRQDFLKNRLLSGAAARVVERGQRPSHQPLHGDPPQ